VKSEVLPSSGEYGIEFLIALTLPQFKQAIKEQEWTNLQRYSQLLKMLNGTLKTAWEETLETDYPLDSDCTKDNWPKAIDKLIICFLNCKKSRDMQWRYLDIRKPPMSHQHIIFMGQFR